MGCRAQGETELLNSPAVPLLRISKPLTMAGHAPVQWRQCTMGDWKMTGLPRYGLRLYRVKSPPPPPPPPPPGAQAGLSYPGRASQIFSCCCPSLNGVTALLHSGEPETASSRMSFFTRCQAGVHRPIGDCSCLQSGCRLHGLSVGPSPGHDDGFSWFWCAYTYCRWLSEGPC